MEEAKEVQLNILSNGSSKAENATEDTNPNNRTTKTITDQEKTKTNRLRWVRLIIYSVFILAGQSTANLLGRLYFKKGGNSSWMATLVQPAGFPILLPLYFFLSSSKHEKNPSDKSDETVDVSRPKPAVLASIYVVFGLFIMLNSLLYSIGLKHLPVSTYSIIGASQLGFNALFSFFINKQKFTPYIVNSLVLLTISSALLVLHSDPSSNNNAQSSGSKYIIGFVCTLAASAQLGLMLTLTQYFLTKVVKTGTNKILIDMLVYPAIISTIAVIVGLFASGEWKGIGKEMKGFELGQVSYLIILISTAICWQVYSVGNMGLIFEVSSLFSNVISILGLPIVPVLAVLCFHDSMNGVKVVSMVLAFWGFVSYIYQHYLDEYKPKTETNAAKDQTYP